MKSMHAFQWICLCHMCIAMCIWFMLTNLYTPLEITNVAKAAWNSYIANPLFLMYAILQARDVTVFLNYILQIPAEQNSGIDYHHAKWAKKGLVHRNDEGGLANLWRVLIAWKDEWWLHTFDLKKFHGQRSCSYFQRSSHTNTHTRPFLEHPQHALK